MLPQIYFFVLCLHLNSVYSQIDDKSSLTFVIDNTMSMWDDIQQVKISANAMFDTVYNSNATQIEDFVLVIFRDPEVELKTVTKSRNTYKDALASMELIGNYDCPEMSMAGIERALSHSRPGSYLYVFTDADSKDGQKYETIKQLAMKQRSQITFILTGVCQEGDTGDSEVYKKLASDTNGQVFYLYKTEVSKLLNYVRNTVTSRKTVLLAKTLPAGAHNITYPVDGTIKELVISVSGTHPTVNVFDPYEEYAVFEELVSLLNVEIVKVKNVKPGVYRAEIKSESESRVVVTGTTNVHFQHGFSGFKPLSFNDTTIRPIPDQKSYLSLKLTTEDKSVELISAQILDMQQNVLYDMSLTETKSDIKFYVSEPFVPPNHTFQIAMKAFDSVSGTTITRLSLTPVEPQTVTVTTKSKAPTAIIPGDTKITIAYEDPLQLKCKVNAYPKPTIIWEDNDLVMSNSSVSVVELPYDYISVLDVASVYKNSTYVCKASNAYGTDVKKIEVHTKRTVFFDVLQTPKDTTIEYGKEGRFDCIISASPPARIKWYRNKRRIQNGKLMNVEISADQSTLLIRSMHPALTGKYSCVAKNYQRQKTFIFKVSIEGVARPAIDKRVVSELIVKEKDDVNFTCNVTEGKPKPKIHWFYENYLGEKNTLDEQDQTLSIKSVNPYNAGTYICMAENVAGRDYLSTELIIEYPPAIIETAKIVRVNEGDKIRLPCEVEGEPTPKIQWFANGVMIAKGRGYHFHEDYLSFKPAVYDNGTYICVAENKHGITNTTIRVEINIPVNIEVPKETSIEVKVGDDVTLPCIAHGLPAPTIQWIYQSIDVNATRKKPNKDDGSLQFARIQAVDTGFYTCMARNAAGSANITYEVKVYAPPLIISTSRTKEFTAVVGDVALNIPCKVTGYPTPDITWTKDGLNIALGPYYEIQNDGSLTIKSIDKSLTGLTSSYVCHASNSLGVDTELYEVTILDIPKNGPITKSMLLEEGSSSAIPCHVPHDKTDSLRWYKDGKVKFMGELVLNNTRKSDSGIYICRVSNFSGARSGNVEVKIGYKPRFLTNVQKHVVYKKDTTTVLDCRAEGFPTPDVTWWHDGTKISEKRMTYNLTQMKEYDRGQYYCLLKNSFGYIVRPFEILSHKECFLNTENGFNGKQPLITDRNLQWSNFYNSNGTVRLLEGEEVVLNCPIGFKRFDNTRLLVTTCKQDQNLLHVGNTYKFTDFQCNDEFKPVIQETGISCLKSTNSKSIRIGYNVLNRFLEVYEICLDTNKRVPLYSKQTIHRSLSSVEPKRTKWIHTDLLPYHFDSLYDCSHQVNTISSALQRWFHTKDNCCFSKRQLVNSRDVLPGLQQIATFHHLNVIPQWSTCNSDNWERIESRVRSLAKSTDDLMVWTGTSEQLTLDGKSSEVDINIRDKEDRQIPVPRYLWKVIQDPKTLKSIAIIQLNVPDIDASKAYRHMRCRDICSDVDWMKSATWRRANRGYTYCCTIQEFEKAFGYEGLFGSGHREILNDV